MAPKKSSRSSAQRRRRAAAARRASEIEEQQLREAEPPPRRSLFGRIIERRPDPGAAPGAEDPAPVVWSRRGLLTLVLIVAVLQIPLAIVSALNRRDLSFAFWLVYTLAPNVLPITLALSCLIAMPLARRLARESRNMRVLETLGVAAVVYIFLIIFWGSVSGSYGGITDERAKQGGVIASLALADAISLVGGAFVYPYIARYLSPSRRMRK